ncbi:MAG: glycosyltransferase family 2 protein [Candidatus Eisenbacteria bacterium]|uniref:Glycosyltransferase family 2 protein n=1 Tax=Eiseniibacteriota bacterium TaxID=2212470 RepID=A0A849SJC4_UNCEI|nr:glycosyltransferase family 2 protein [Candidatus Eisenbacteria bacterium]
MTRARVAIVIPALDEESVLPGVLAELNLELERTSAGRDWDLAALIVVDNGSRDRTAAVAGAGGATVVLEPRRGYGAACLAGLARLAANPPDIVAFMDADGSDDPRELSQLVAPIIAGRAALVIGSRVIGTVEPGALTVVQRFGNRLASWLLRSLFGVQVSDLGPFRAIEWSALERLAMRDRDYGWTVEMQARAARTGIEMLEVAASWRRRRGGESKVSGTVRGVFGAGSKILTTIVRVRLERADTHETRPPDSTTSG